MSVVFPWFLLALLTLAIPVIIHLFYFRRYKKVYFSDIRFLKQVQEEKSTIDRLKRRLILAARLLALLFLVLAFAQPFLRRDNDTLKKGNSAVCIYIDNSYSMGLKSGGEAALEMAKAKATEIARAFTSGDKFALLTNDLEGMHQRWMQQQDFLDAVSRIELSPNVQRIDEISRRQSGLFQSAGTANKLGFFLSDFQTNALARVTDTTFKAHFLPIQGTPEKNVYVDTCWLEQPVFTLNTANKLIVRFKNSGNATTEPMRVSVKINEAVKALDDIVVPANGEVLDSFNFSITQPGWQKGEISFNDYPITFDDHFYFAFRVAAMEKVLSIEDSETPPNASAVFAQDAHFQVDRANKGQLDYSSFPQYALIILNQVTEISSGLSASLKEYVNNGGNLYVIPAKQADLNSYNSLLAALKAGSYAPLKQEAGSVTGMNMQEDIFRGVFSQLPKNMETPKIRQYYPIRTLSGNNSRAILTTDLESPLLVKFDAGKSWVYLQSVPLHADFSDLASRAVFPALLYNTAVYQKNRQPLYFIAGRDNLIELQRETAASGNESVFQLSNGQYAFIAENRSVGNQILLQVRTTLPSDGHYAISSGNQQFGIAAFNIDRTESRLQLADKAQLATTYNGPQQQLMDQSKTNLAAQVKQIKDGILLWKLCVILSLAFLLAEILLIRFWK